MTPSETINIPKPAEAGFGMLLLINRVSAELHYP
jgi:hypothetical protein